MRPWCNRESISLLKGRSRYNDINMRRFEPLGYQVARKIKPVVVDGPPSKMVQSMEKTKLLSITINANLTLKVDINTLTEGVSSINS